MTTYPARMARRLVARWMSRETWEEFTETRRGETVVTRHFRFLTSRERAQGARWSREGCHCP